MKQYSGIRYGLLCSLLFLVSCTVISAPKKLEIAKEYPKANEANTIKVLTHELTRSIEKKYPNSTMLRDAHPKQHGCVRAKVTIPNLAAELKVGLFRQAGQYPAWIRYSTATESVDHDKDKTMLGMALKIMNVKGEKLLADEKQENTQDILLLSNPVLPIRNAEDFLKIVKRKAFFFINHFYELKIALSTRKNHPTPLGIRYWSTTPYLFGEGRAVKFSAKPCSVSTVLLPKSLSENYLRDAMSKQLASEGACFDLMVQFQTNANTMPIEDATIVWDESVSPFKKVARIEIPKQSFGSATQTTFCENLSMTPWHSLVEHRPLGSINRARKDVYRGISQYRHTKNKVERKEPAE